MVSGAGLVSQIEHLCGGSTTLPGDVLQVHRVRCKGVVWVRARGTSRCHLLITVTAVGKMRVPNELRLPFWAAAIAVGQSVRSSHRRVRVEVGLALCEKGVDAFSGLRAGEAEELKCQ